MKPYNNTHAYEKSIYHPYIIHTKSNSVCPISRSTAEQLRRSQRNHCTRPLASHTTADLPSATPHEATPAPAFPISTTTVDGKEVVFDYKEEQGLVAAYKKERKSQDFTPIAAYPILEAVNGKKLRCSKMSMSEALLFAREAKVGVSNTEELKYLGMRGRGGVLNRVLPKPVLN